LFAPTAKYGQPQQNLALALQIITSMGKDALQFQLAPQTKSSMLPL
jgi:hypothetical protein